MKQAIGRIVGEGNVTDKDEELETFSKDYSVVSPKKPKMVVKVQDPDEVLNVVLKLNEEGAPLYPSSSKVHFYGGTIPRKEDAVVMDLSGMNRIHEIDEINHWVHIEPGVTWGQLQQELEKKGYRSIIPLLPHPDRSVLMDLLEREQPTLCKFEYSEMLASMWVVWGIGEKFTTGSASINTFRQEGCLADGVNPQGPGSIDFWRLLQGSQGTFGIVTKGICKIELIPSVSKTFFFSAENLGELIAPLYEMGHRYVGFERFLVNHVSLAAILGDPSLKASLPHWVIINVVSGLPIGRPDEMVDYQADYIQNQLEKKFPCVTLEERLEGAPSGTEEKLPEMLRKPWPQDKVYWKHSMKGNCQEVIFMTSLNRAPEFVEAFENMGIEVGYPFEDIGIYVQPVEDMRACQMTFMLPYDLKDEQELKRIRELYNRAIVEVVNKGGFFNRIYDGIGDIVYNLPRAQGYVRHIQRVKRLFDPNWILSPGKLCF
ncbi:MAG: FAD-binding oxidoreductase [Deltaproteobacteria bacterium]|nr:MAG: FAD-binding oxidoreductase [Deltaproteobacteria bacterium]